MRLLCLIFAFILLIVLNSFAQSASELFDKSVEQLKNREFDQAIKGFTKVYELNSYYYEALYYRGLAYNETNKPHQALQDFTQCIQKKNDFFPAYYQRALLHNQNNKPELAMQDFSKVIQLFPSMTDAYRHRYVLFFRLEKYEDAIQDISAVIKDCPTEAGLYYQRALCHFYLNNYRNSLADIRKTKETEPDHRNALMLAADIYYLQKKHTDAIRELSLILNNNTNDTLAFEKRARISFEASEYGLALTDYNTLIQNFRYRDNETMLNRGICNLETGNYREAVKDFTKLTTGNRASASIYVYRAHAHLAMKKYTPAITDCNKAISLDPRDATAYAIRGEAWFLQNKFDLALPDLNQALKLKPMPDAYYYRAIIKDLNKDRNGACLDLKEAARLGHKEAIKKAESICR